MKNFILILSILFSLNSYSQYTFELDLSLYNGAYTSVDFYRAGNSYPMTNTGGNIYSYTASLPPIPGLLTNCTYKFIVDGVSEHFSTLSSCLTISNNDTLRIINLNTTIPSIVCWESCSPCITAMPGCTDSTANNYNSIANVDDGSCEYNITFIVDMSETSSSFSTPEVNGTFNSWCGNCASMTDANNDSIWEVTIPLVIGNYEYKFSADNWNIQESLYEFDNCITGSAPYFNRQVNVNGNQILDTICWNRCYSCDTERNYYNATFKLDMSNVTASFANPEVNGTFNNWCGNCWVLDPQGNNIYSKSFNIDTSLHTFKFSADNWSIQENLDSTLSCVDLGFDSTGALQYVNRVLKLTSDTTIEVCWESCNPCITIIYGCKDSIAINYNPIATIDDSSCIYCAYGCTDILACNYDSLATCDDSSCLTIYGCTDSLACNYNSAAQCDDGSCLTLFGCTDPLAYNFDSLTTCNDSSCIYEYNVTFQLDLREQTSISYTTPEINGTFNGWCGNCAQMTDVNNDSIWEITVAILEGTGPVSGVPGWEYKFSADNWNIQENLFSGDPCTFTSSGYTNRFINITKDTILDPVCWGSCNDCYVPQTSYNVTFQVDMANVSGFSVPEINGVFNEWCGSCWPMTDIDGDNIWEFTALIDTSIQEYKFSADNWTIQEDLDSNLSCILINYDSASPNGWGYVNRYLNINSDTLLEILCWNECDTCLSTTGFISNVNNHSYTIYPNPSTSIFYVKSSDKIDKIIVYDILNKKIFEKNDPAILQSFDISDINSNILFLEIYINDKVRRDKLIITK